MSDRKYFGTDGIRGRANTYPMTAEVALRVGLAAGKESNLLLKYLFQTERAQLALCWRPAGHIHYVRAGMARRRHC